MKSSSHPIKLITTQDGSHTYLSEQFHSTYHSVNGAIEESTHVFIHNGLIPLINEKDTVDILEVGFGTGLNAYLSFLQTQLKPIIIHYESVEAYPISQEDAQALNYIHGYESSIGSVFLNMHEQEWNVAHLLSSRFNFTKHLVKLEDFKTNQQFDLIYYDAFSPKEQPELWTESVFRQLYAVLKPGGVLVTYCAQGQMKRHLKAVGFHVSALPGYGSKREMTRAEKK